jgi:phage N-6-adenine-methyltransferase
MTHERKDGRTDLKDESRTPPSLFKRLNDRFMFDIDIAATAENTLCEQFWRKENSFLAADSHLEPDETGFCNPPYSRGLITPFVKKCYEESLTGATVVMLLPADLSTAYFRNYCMRASEWIVFEGRVIFNNPDGTPMQGSPKFASYAVVFQECKFDGSPVVSTMPWR